MNLQIQKLWCGVHHPPASERWSRLLRNGGKYLETVKEVRFIEILTEKINFLSVMGHGQCVQEPKALPGRSSGGWTKSMCPLHGVHFIAPSYRREGYRSDIISSLVCFALE